MNPSESYLLSRAEGSQLIDFFDFFFYIIPAVCTKRSVPDASCTTSESCGPGNLYTAGD